MKKKKYWRENKMFYGRGVYVKRVYFVMKFCIYVLAKIREKRFFFCRGYTLFHISEIIFPTKY